MFFIFILFYSEILYFFIILGIFCHRHCLRKFNYLMIFWFLFQYRFSLPDFLRSLRAPDHLRYYQLTLTELRKCIRVNRTTFIVVKVIIGSDVGANFLSCVSACLKWYLLLALDKKHKLISYTTQIKREIREVQKIMWTRSFFSSLFSLCNTRTRKHFKYTKSLINYFLI